VGDPAVLLFGVLLPAVVAGIVLLVSALRARAEPGRERPVAGALACGLAYLAAQTALSGVPDGPWSENAVLLLGWVYWTVALAIVLSPLRLGSIARFGNSLYRALFCILPYHLVRTDDGARAPFDLLGLATVLATFGIWIALERLAARRPGPSLPIALWAACAGCAGVLLLASSAQLAQLAGALAASLGAAAVVALLVRGAHLPSGAIAILAVACAGLLRIASIYGLSDAACALAAAAFLGPWLGEIPALRARSPRLAGAVAFLGALLPAAGAVAIAYSAYSAKSPPLY
jgi:hypothetical protein